MARADITGEVAAVLDRARELSRPQMQAAVSRLTPSMARVAGYHLGWLDARGATVESDTGKGIRPALAILSAEAAGADAGIGVPGAVAVELIHNFSLLHDDLMDGDKERHHRPTAWTVFGSSAAILGGVALLTLAEEILLDVDPPAGAAAAQLVTRSTARLVTGQTHDLEFESRSQVAVAECLAMAGDKTAALMSCASAVGAVLAGAGPATVAALAEYGEHLGLAFQLVDDLLGIWGAPERTGKPVLADLRAGKKTLPVVAALAAGGRDAERLAHLLAPGESETGYVEAAKLIEDLGGRGWARDEATRQLRAALDTLTGTPSVPAAVSRALAAIGEYVVSREL